MTKKNNSNSEIKKTVAILSLCCFIGANSWINPIMQLLGEAFPYVSYQNIRLLSTLPALVTMICVMVAGALVGKKIHFLPTVSTGLICIVAAGLIPFFSGNNFALLMASRVIMGIGVGLIGIRNTLVIKSFDEPMRSKVLGWVLLASNGANILMQPIIGYLGELNWKISFLAYIIAVIPIILLNLWVKEPASELNLTDEISRSTPRHRGLEKRVWLYMFNIFFFMMLTYPLHLGLSNYIATKFSGGSALTGSIMSFSTLGGALVGINYGKLQQKTGKYIWTLMYGLAAFGIATMLATSVVTTIFVSIIFVGMASSLTTIAMPKFASITAYPETLALSVSMMTACGQLGNYASTYWMMLVEKLFPSADAFSTPLKLAVAVYGIMFLLSLFKDLRPSELLNESDR